MRRPCATFRLFAEHLLRRRSHLPLDPSPCSDSPISRVFKSRFHGARPRRACSSRFRRVGVQRASLAFLCFVLFTTAAFSASCSFAQSVEEPVDSQQGSALLASVRRESAKMEVFPLFMTVGDFFLNRDLPYSVSRDSIDHFFDLTFERFKPFYLWLETAFYADADEIDACVDAFDELNPREQALVLISIHLFLVVHKRQDLPYCQDKEPDVRMRSMSSPCLRRFFSDFDWMNPPEVEISQEKLEQWIALIDSCAARDEVAFDKTAFDKGAPERYASVLYQDISWQYLRFLNFFDDPDVELIKNFQYEAIATAKETDPRLLYYQLIQMSSYPERLPRRNSYRDLDPQLRDAFLTPDFDPNSFKLEFVSISEEDVRREISIMRQFVRTQYNQTRRGDNNVVLYGVIGKKELVLGEIAHYLSLSDEARNER